MDSQEFNDAIIGFEPKEVRSQYEEDKLQMRSIQRVY